MHDTKNLKKAKEIVYKMGFYEGVMLVSFAPLLSPSLLLPSIR